MEFPVNRLRLMTPIGKTGGVIVKQPSIALSASTINDLVGKIRIIASQYNLVSLNRQIEVSESLLKENALIDVAILGQFKAGKSSFINSLTGKPVLPTGVTPVTTVITRLQYGETERASVRYSDGASSLIDIEDVGNYVSEANNPSNSKKVSFVDIELPSMIDYQGLRLVDTPGLGSVFKAHIKESEEWLPEVGAAILAISADRPLSADDLELIRELMDYTPNIIVLMTKADLLTPKQQQEVVDFFKDTLTREIKQNFPIFLYSIRENMERFREIIEDKVLSGLSKNRDVEFIRILNHKSQSLLKSCISYLEIALKASLESDHERDNFKNQILDEKTGYDQIRREAYAMARDNKHQTRTVINNHLKQFKKPLTKKLTLELGHEMVSWKVNLWKMTELYKGWLKSAMGREMSIISKEENAHFRTTLKSTYESLTRYLQNFRMHLESNIEKVLGIKLAQSDWKIEVSEPEKPDVKVLFGFDTHIDLLWFLIPMFIFRKLFERHFLNQIPWSVEVNLSRLATQWEERINKAIDGLLKQTLKYIKNEISTVEALLSGAHGNTDEIRETISQLRKNLTT
jgi:GTP-binding protein EngB required for normal cell division